jgi:hypothetical protein
VEGVFSCDSMVGVCMGVWGPVEALQDCGNM